MALVQIDLPDPLSMRGRWAALAAVRAAGGRGDGCRAQGLVWHYDDGDGGWADLHHLGDGRAVLLGQDRDDSHTFYAEASDFYEEKETDLLAGAPDWWEPPVRAAREAELFLGFVYGFDGSTWRRAAYDADDGFGSVGLPALDDGRAEDVLRAALAEAPGPQGAEPSGDAVRALIAADGVVTEELLGAVVPPAGWDVSAGVAAARAFTEA
ncbi:proteophosphoglycan 5 [Streptomyces sp. NPDC005899]|uniref:proteophosphoglycan 5 n=1 Tax=Streptomyces sp. NPDC005899 TaxID=3155716 RepID=UPI003400BAF6